MDGLEIRAATAADLKALAGLYGQFASQDDPCRPNPSHVALMLRDDWPDTSVLLGTIGEVPVASCTLVVVPDAGGAGTPRGRIETVVTDAGWRRCGFGSSLMREAADRAWRAGCDEISLPSRSNAPATRALCASVGFEQADVGFRKRR